MDQMMLHTFPSTQETARAAAHYLGSQIDHQLRLKDRVSVALSGGRTPWLMLDELAQKNLDWTRIDVFQVDERFVALDDDRLNANHIRAHWVSKVIGLSFYPMPVELNTHEACASYRSLLERHCGVNGVIDIVCLGLGADAHTASLVPGDPLVDNTSDWVGSTILYQDTQRITLMRKILDVAAVKCWLVTGSDKSWALQQLLARNTQVPAGLLQGKSVMFADQAATGEQLPVVPL